MSISSLHTEIERLRRDISQLVKKQSEFTKTISEYQARINRVSGSITRTTSSSSHLSKQNDIARYTKEISSAQEKLSVLSKDIGNKEGKLYKAMESLAKEEEREQLKNATANKRLDKEHLDRQKLITRELEHQKRIAGDISAPSPFYLRDTQISTVAEKQFDAFISHASEDKDEFVRPLAEKLKELGIEVWYDEFTLKVGDSLRRSVDSGLKMSRFGIVVFSSAFFAKEWPQYELDGLVAREMQGKKVILPIWHKVTKDEVMAFSPSLSDKLALNSFTQSIDEIAQNLAEVLNLEKDQI